MGTLLRSLVAGSMLLAAAFPAIAQDPIGAAKELYASAAYEEALLALQAVKARVGPEVARQVDEYRSFCLLALGRTSEAEAAAESAIRQDPLAPLDARDASPRIEAMFTALRKRLLPGLIRDAFRAARATRSKGDSAAVVELRRVRLMLDAARTLGAWDDTLGDLVVLVDGFLDLDRASAVAQATPAATSSTRSSSPEPDPAEDVRPPTARAVPFSVADTDVVAPVVVRQDIPPITRSSTLRGSRRRCFLVVTIDTQGNVENAVIRESISSAIDAQLLKAARSWQYRPATKAGVPVPFVKVISVGVDN